jgi:hypothetical protein
MEKEAFDKLTKEKQDQIRQKALERAVLSNANHETGNSSWFKYLAWIILGVALFVFLYFVLFYFAQRLGIIKVNCGVGGLVCSY